MKLILASDLSFLLKYGYDLTGIPKGQMKIGYVTTASKGVSNTDYIKIFKKQIEEDGYNLEEIDIENKTKKELKEFFKDKNVIHMEGGNTFYLLKAIKETGFDKIINELLSEGKVYIGTSAGSSIMGPTIGFSSHVPDNTSENKLISLNFVPFLIKCHYKDEQEKEYKEKLQIIEYPVKILRDGQGILVEDGEYTFMGDGEEVKLG
ncbi:MAG: Type 1 glutamine amidotransferase-like domain-containing protein [Candidatus Nomurabacteria bacterium]|nr:Type 1 glutamine amidotransferase-like domain-containing protein [Candidatus Nomurabacteria bacterium]